MLTAEAEDEVSRVAAAVLSLRQLAGQLGDSVPVAPVAEWPAPPPERGLTGLTTVLDRAAEQAGRSSYRVRTDGRAARLGVFERVISEYLRVDDLAGALADFAEADRPAIDKLIDGVRADDFDSFCRRTTLRGPDGVELTTYAAGDPGDPAIVLAPACGMPARLCENWIRHLSRRFHVLTWETRGLFGAAPGAFDGAVDMAAQTDDLLTVLEHHEVAGAHVAGLCGGSSIALAAAHRSPALIGSLSLWHGGYDLGDAVARTDHHRNLKALTAMVVQGRVSAAAVHASLSEAALSGVPAGLAHLVLYPYTTPELLHLYCRLNGAIMDADVHQFLSADIPRTLLVTSADDRTAHPAGSHYVADRLPAAELLVRPSGDHLSLFRAGPELLEIAASFARPGGRHV